MVAKTISQTVTGIKDIPYVGPGLLPNPIPTYNRPSDWLTLPTVTSSQQIFVSLLAVMPNQPNTVSFWMTTSTGTYNVNWGDGTSSTHASNEQVTKSYDYATYDPTNTTLSSRGYKQVIITVTPNTGNMTGFQFVNGNFKYNYLDMIFSGNSTFSTISAFSQNCPMLEQFQIMNGLSLGASFFSNMPSLISVPTLNLSAPSFSSLFNNCTALQVVPSSFPFTTNPSISCDGMFQGCTALTYVPNYNNFRVNSATSMFNGCLALETAPNLDMSVCTSFNSMFSGCTKLRFVPNYNTTSSLTNTSNMFSGCNALQVPPFFNTSNVTNTSSMFSNCWDLIQVPLYNLGSCTNGQAMFQRCYALRSVPLFNLSALTNMVAMFQYCYSVTSYPPFNTINVPSMATTFAQNWALIDMPLLNTSNVTNMDQMHYENFALKSVPNYNTSKVTSLNQTFYFNRVLTDFPTLDTANVANMAGAWTGCSGLLSFPNLNTSKVTSMALTWYQCSALPSLNAFDSSNVLNFNGTFANMNNLKAIPAINTSKGTNFLSFAIGCFSLNRFDSTLNMANGVSSGSQIFENCRSLSSIPALNMSNMTTTFNFNGCNALGRIDAFGMRFNTTVNGDNLGNAALETLFLNLGTAATTQTVTITNNPGVNSPFAAINIANCNSTQGTPTISLTTGNTSTLATGMVLTTIAGGGWLTQSVTVTNGVANIAATQNGMQVDQIVSFQATVGSTILANTYYQVRSISGDGNGFEIKAYNSGPSGAAIVPTAGATVTLNRIPTISSLTGNTVTMNMNASGTTSTQTITFRRLNTRLASLKNWTVSG
jgi:hypothetical protein